MRCVTNIHHHLQQRRWRVWRAQVSMEERPDIIETSTYDVGSFFDTPPVLPASPGPVITLPSPIPIDSRPDEMQIKCDMKGNMIDLKGKRSWLITST